MAKVQTLRRKPGKDGTEIRLEYDGFLYDVRRYFGIRGMRSWVIWTAQTLKVAEKEYKKAR